MLIEVLDSIHTITSSFPDLEFSSELQWASPHHDKIFSIARMHSAALGLSVNSTSVHQTAAGITAYSCEHGFGVPSKHAVVRVRSMRW
jgi:hypothetical protein